MSGSGSGTKTFSEIATGTATNHCDSTTLQVSRYRFQVLYPDEEGGQVEYGGEEPEQGQAKLEIQSRQQGRVVLFPGKNAC